MHAHQDRVALIITRLAAIIALAVAVSLPLLDFFSSYRDAGDVLAFKAKVKAQALSGLIASSPDVWTFAENRVLGLIAREPVPLADERVRVFDAHGALVTQSGSDPQAPLLSRRYPLYDADRVAGQLEVSGSLRGVVFEVLAAALVGLLLGALVFVVMRVLPLRALRRVTDALFEEKERAETTLRSISDAVITTDADGRVQYLNPTAELLLGTTLDAVRGQALATLVVLVDGTTKERSEASLYRALRERRVVACMGNNELCRHGKTSVAVEERCAPIFDQEGRIAGGVIVLRDVSASREYLQRRSWEATHDALTGLVNRREFEKRVRDALADAQNSGPGHVVCYLDLDRFKVVNDSCGHAAGDELLIQLARLLQARIRDTDTLARLGGDEFGLLLEGCETRRGQLIAAEILAAVKDFQFAWEAKLFTVGVSIGLTAISGEHIDVAEVLGEADSACYWAKEQGRNRVCVYLASDMDLAARRSETGWVARINAAFEEQRFVLYHQDYRLLNVSAGNDDHLEILLRMIGEDGEIIAPGSFLPAAERYNLMPEIDRWVIDTVFSQYHALRLQRGTAPTCAINLSGASINSDGFLDFIRERARRYALPPGSICFELTETVAVNNLHAAAEFISACKAIGFQFALDDFGTGTSSFGYLKKLPVDYLKIDGGFVKDIEHDRVDQAMTETINRIGHIMGMRTIAEYAENEAIIERLQAIGVDFAQGYGVCLPKPLLAPASLPV
jgi:diguanylate cyclase (GGDEF)-like protein/PAS domain S-box-containing protein